MNTNRGRSIPVNGSWVMAAVSTACVVGPVPDDELPPEKGNDAVPLVAGGGPVGLVDPPVGCVVVVVGSGVVGPVGGQGRSTRWPTVYRHRSDPAVRPGTVTSASAWTTPHTDAGYVTVRRPVVPVAVPRRGSPAV